MADIFEWDEFKLPKVHYRKLGKHRLWGYQFKNSIHIDERLKNKELFEIEIHEFLHWLYPDKEEGDIVKDSRMMTEFFWSLNYRKANQ